MYKYMTVRSLDYLNRCKVLWVYADIIVWIWQKVNEAFPRKHLPVKSSNSNTKKECEMFQGLLERH